MSVCLTLTPSTYCSTWAAIISSGCTLFATLPLSLFCRSVIGQAALPDAVTTSAGMSWKRLIALGPLLLLAAYSSGSGHIPASTARLPRAAFGSGIA